jgi:hypothetical protein
MDAGRKRARILLRMTQAHADESSAMPTPKATTEPQRPPDTAREALCRFCGAVLTQTFADLGASPLCESFLRPDQLEGHEPFYPLHVRVCDSCFLVQLEEFVPPEEIFTEYAYFSSYSDSWVEHARRYALSMVERFGLSDSSLVIEVASNDGYLLQHFVAIGVPVLGIEPALNVARVAAQRGVPTESVFFGVETAERLVAEGRRGDLVAGNNVLAQVPDLNDFVEGLSIVLAPDGVLTLEFPHLMRLIEENQFDTIYHEHFSYFSFLTTRRILDAHGLRVFDVEELPTHGGSLRVFACREAAPHAETERARQLVERERVAGFDDPATYRSFQQQVIETKWRLLEYLIAARRAGKQVVGYGAPGKGNTLLNYCGIRTDFLAYTVDRNPYKHGLFLPGTRIPIYAPEHIAETRPDVILILPWNLKDEIVDQLAYAKQWGAEFVVPIPSVQVVG